MAKKNVVGRGLEDNIMGRGLEAVPTNDGLKTRGSASIK